MTIVSPAVTKIQKLQRYISEVIYRKRIILIEHHNFTQRCTLYSLLYVLVLVCNFTVQRMAWGIGGRMPKWTLI